MALAAPARELGSGALELVERLVGRKLRQAETAIDVLRLDQALNDAKDELTAAILAEMVAATAAWKAGAASRPSLKVTAAMRAPLDRLTELGRQEALLELDRLGYQGIRGPSRRFAHATPAPEGRDLDGYLRTNLRRVEHHIEDELVAVDLSLASQDAIAQALLRVPGGRDIASRLVSTALIDGIGMTFEDNADLVKCWEYTAVLDAGTCSHCAPLDGRKYQTLEALFADLPNFGPNPRCKGGGRCRCRAVPCHVDEAGQNPVDPQTGQVTPLAEVSELATGLAMRGTFKPVTDEVFGAIAKVHRLPADTPKIPIARNATRTRAGGYRYYGATATKRQEAVDIQVSKFADDPENTLAHEIGHWIDDQAIGRTLGLNAEATAENAPEIAEVIGAIENSAAYDGLLELRDAPGAMLKVTVRRRDEATGEITETQIERPPDRQRVRYLLQRHELWARAYAQYIATRSGSAVMRRQIERDAARPYYDGWKDDDFEPIAEAFDRLFGRLGWSES